MKIQIRDPEEFRQLLFALVREATQAHDHFRLYRDLSAAKAEYSTEFILSWTFWYLTFRAHLDATMVRLCRAYDQHSSGLNLRNLIDTIHANQHLFEEPHLRERLKGNPLWIRWSRTHSDRTHSSSAWIERQ